MRDTVRFTLNGVSVELRAPNPTRTVLEWLREDRRLTGTKEGCAEGDCGACTIAIRDADGAIRAINSCIQFLPMIDGCALVTVEGLGGSTAVQTALVAEHGSQCGFCTPGIVMSLHAHHARGGSTETSAITDALAGNLCRCTGYGPIIRAGQKACATPKPEILAAQPQSDPLGYEHTGSDGATSCFFAPDTLAELLRLTARYPDAILLAGATDVGLWVTKQGRRLETIVSVMRVAELQQLKDVGDQLEIGAAVRYADALDALATLHSALRDYIRRLGAVQVRDSGTVVGNIANGSPIGDMPPILIALGARVHLSGASGERTLRLEDYFLTYGKQDRKPGEIVTRLSIPHSPPDASIAAEKISKRFEQDISAVSAGFFLRLKDGVVSEVRLAYGGMAGIPRRAATAEAALSGRPWTEPNVRSAMTALANDFQPLSDWRGSADYRLATAQNLLLRFFHDSTAGKQRVTNLASIAHG